MIQPIHTPRDAPAEPQLAAPPPSPEDTFAADSLVRVGLGPPLPVPQAWPPSPPAPETHDLPQLQQELKRAHDCFLRRKIPVDQALRRVTAEHHTTASYAASNRDLCGQLEQLTQALSAVAQAARAARVNPTILPSCMAKYLQVHQRHMQSLLGQGLSLATENPGRMQPTRVALAKLALTYEDFTLYLPADRDLLGQIVADWDDDPAVTLLARNFYLAIGGMAGRAAALRGNLGGGAVLDTLASRWRAYGELMVAPLHVADVPPAPQPWGSNL